MAHPLVLGLFRSSADAVSAARHLHSAGVSREAISVVARSHAEQGVLAESMDATPGVEMEDSWRAARLGELGARVIAAAATVMPGVASLMAAGPLAAEFGEAAGHWAGGLDAILTRAGVDERSASALQEAVANGSVLLGIHARRDQVDRVREILASAGVQQTALASWEGESPSA